MNKYTDYFNAKDPICRHCYDTLRGAFLNKGLIPSAIEKSKLLIDDDGTTCWVAKAAFNPTGVALGCALPDPAFSQQLFRAAHDFETNIEPFIEFIKPSFSFVPIDAYHVTLVNYSHFDCVDHNTQIVPLDQFSLDCVIEYFKNNMHPTPCIRFKGLLITQSGRLIVPGYAMNGVVYAIRSDLVELNPVFTTNLPNTLHIKLGHVLCNLRPDFKQQCQDIVDRLGRGIDTKVSFKQVYTPIKVLSECFL